MNSKNTIRGRNQDIFNVSEGELESVLESYLEEGKKVAQKKSMLNPVTIAGFAFLVIGFIALIQQFFPIGGDLSTLIGFTPLVGGLLVVAIGLGFFVGEKKKPKTTKDKGKRFIDSGGDRLKSEGGLSEVSEKSDKKEPWALRKRRKLYRSRKDSKIAGICGGIAQYFGLDSTLVRIAYVASVFLSSGSSLLVYPALMFILPKEPKKE
jgi:phage shock protein C